MFNWRKAAVPPVPDESTRSCPTCMELIPSLSKVCKHCKLRVDLGKMRACPVCTEEIPEASKVCKHCKAKVDSRPMRECPICTESIPAFSKVCRECKSDLTWRGYVSISNTTLALMTALIAVSAALGPAVKRLFLQDDSAISAVYVGLSAGEVAFLLSNSGSKAGSVKSAEFFMEWTVREPGPEDGPDDGASRKNAAMAWGILSGRVKNNTFEFSKQFYPAGGAALLQSQVTDQRVFLTTPQAPFEVGPAVIDLRDLYFAVGIKGRALYRDAKCRMRVQAKHASGGSEILDVPVDCIDFDRSFREAFDERMRIERQQEKEALERAMPDIERSRDAYTRKRAIEQAVMKRLQQQQTPKRQ
jgi:predicted amidophosphoribosyltransferase